MFGVLTTSQFADPKIKCSENPSDCSHRQNVVKVRNNIISIVQSNIDTSVCLHNSCEPTNCKLNYKAQCKKHWSCELLRTTIESSQPTKNFNPCWDCNNHSSTGKICSCIYIETYGKHVMSPDLKSENCNSSHSIDHSNITKDWFTCKKTQNMRNNSKSWLNQNINFWMTKKPKLMLILNYITSTCRQEKGCIKVTVSEKHSEPCSKNRLASNLLNTNKADRPNKQWKAVQSHSLCSHICDGDEKVNTSLNASNSSNVKTENSQINSCTRMSYCTALWRICGPANSWALFYLSTQDLESQTSRQNPKRNIIHSWKSHICCSNHHWHLPISKASYKCWHHHKKLHELSVRCNLCVVQLSVPIQNTWTYRS